MRKLIIRLFRINVAGLSRQQAEQQLYELIKEYDPKDIPDDIKENYHIEDIWLPITQGDSKVDVIYPPKFEAEVLNLEEAEDLNLEELEKLINKLQKIKEEWKNN